MSYLKTRPDDTRFPDMEACVAALPLAYQHGADEIRVICEGERFGRTYTVAAVEAALGLHPHLASLQGLGNVDPAHGWNFMEGRHIPYI